MNCRKYEKWISDAFDLALSEKKTKILEEHLARCQDCRVYRECLSKIQEEALRVKATEVAPSYWEEFSRSLDKKVRVLETRKEATRPFRPSWKWAWLGASVVLALVLSFLLLRDRGQALDQDVFSFEACLDRLDQVIGDDAGLAENFNTVLSASLQEELDSATMGESLGHPENPFFWENLSDDELQLIEQEIKKI